MARVPRGAGIYPLSPAGRLLLAKRSRRTTHGGTWAGFGGTLEPEDGLTRNPYETCAVRELFEEAGYSGALWLYQLSTDRFLGLVPFEFTPRLNWEHSTAAWFTLSEACGLQPKHWGLRKLLDDTTAMSIITSME